MMRRTARIWRMLSALAAFGMAFVAPCTNADACSAATHPTCVTRHAEPGGCAGCGEDASPSVGLHRMLCGVSTLDKHPYPDQKPLSPPPISFPAFDVAGALDIPAPQSSPTPRPARNELRVRPSPAQNLRPLRAPPSNDSI